MTSSSTTTQNWRTINIDALDPDSHTNFPLTSLTPTQHPSVTAADAQQLAGQIRQLLRGGDAEGALRGALENVPWGGEERAKEVHFAMVMEVLQGIKQSEISGIVGRVYESAGGGGSEVLDTLVRYLYKGMSQSHNSNTTTSSSSPSPSKIPPQATGFSQISARSGGGGVGEGTGQAMSVLLSWHEKVVEIAGLGCICRAMTDRKTV